MTQTCFLAVKTFLGEAKNRQHPSSSISQHHPQHQLPCNAMGSRVDEGRGLQLVCMQPTPLHATICYLICMQGVLHVNFCTQALTIDDGKADAPRCRAFIRRCSSTVPCGPLSLGRKVEGDSLGGPGCG